MEGAGFRTATMDERPEVYGVCEVGFGHIRAVVEVFGADPASATQAIDLANELREQDIANRVAGQRTLQALALIHDCDAHAVPYVSEGALGHGWECGKCGKFLQAG